MRLRSIAGSRDSFSLRDATGDGLSFSFSLTSLGLMVLAFGVTGRCDADLRPALGCRRDIENIEFRSAEWDSSEPLDKTEHMVKTSWYHGNQKGTAPS